MASLKFTTLNVRGIRNNNKRFNVFNWLSSNNYDISFLQETYCTKDFENKFHKGWKGDIVHSISKSPHCAGVCIMLNHGLDYKILSTFKDNDGRIVLLNIMIQDTEYTICNVYCPTDVRRRIVFLKDAYLFILKHALSKKNLIIGGDFNCITNEIDRYSKVLDKTSESLKEFKEKLSLVDVWRHMHVDEVAFTFIDPSGDNRNSRIDLLLLPACHVNIVESSSIKFAPVPDHRAVSMTVKTFHRPRGKGYWKLNNSVLQDENYVNSIVDMFHNSVQQYKKSVSPSLFWEYFKKRIREFSISYCVLKFRERKQNEIELEKKLQDLEKKLAINVSEDLIRERNEVKNNLDLLWLEKSKGYHVRSRVKWVEDGERSTSYFLGLEKKRQSNNCITSLKDVNGLSQSADKDILTVASSFYSDLYTSCQTSDHSINEYLDSINKEKVNKLTEAEAELCEGLVSLHECTEALGNMKLNKSPGLDGLSTEFYKKFWFLLGPLLVEVFNESFNNGKLPESQRQCVMTLLFKKEDREEISNYRPISLTNCDYKILAFVLSARLQKVIGKIVSSDQSAYIKQRYIGTNIRLVNDIFDFYNNSNKTGILLFTDFRKAFDSLEFNFLFKVLKFFGFKTSFIKWIQTIYNDSVACVKNNGHFSDFFSIHRGIKQGCSASALLFILCVEIMAIKIRESNTLKGIRHNAFHKHIKISQYADDTVIFLNNEAELAAALNLLDAFGLLSGLRLNKHKCEGMWLGKNLAYQQSYSKFGIKWPSQVRYLGIYIGYDHKQIHSLNWLSKVDKLEGILESWSKRDLSLFGRVQVIKSLAIPQILASLTYLPIQTSIIDNINKLLFKFIWRSQDKIKRSLITLPIEAGGLGMIDLHTFSKAVKANWMNRIVNACPENDSWVQLPLYHFQHFDIDIFHQKFNFDESVNFSLLSSLPKFYNEVFRFYNLAFTTDQHTFENNIFNESIWGNKYITKEVRKKKSVLFLRNWVRSGIRKVSDLRFINGRLDENFIYAKVGSKQNILSEIFQVRKALLPYKNLLAHNNSNKKVDDPCFKKAKHFYHHILNNKRGDNIEYKYITSICKDWDLDNIFRFKVSREKEIKLKEFNFKVLHGILPCNKNLQKWRIKLSDKCDVCDMSQSIQHLLVDCQYVKPLWCKVDNLFNIRVTFPIILGVESSKYNNVLTVISFLIYKEWLLASLAQKSRPRSTNLIFFKEELSFRIAIYLKCKKCSEENTSLLKKVLDALQQI